MAVEYKDIVQRLINVEKLAELPFEGEKCKQWSSYDRRSKYDSETDSYIGWGANADGDGIIRQEGEEQVIAEIDGPGVIWRVWSADPKEGHIKIYIDDAEEPVLDMPFKDYFDNSKPLFNFPELVYIKARGCNNYLPITFQKSCKITLSEEWGAYYHVTYGEFPEESKVPSFKGKFNEEDRKALQEVNDNLKEKRENPFIFDEDEEVEEIEIKVGPGETVDICSIDISYIDECRAITSLQVKMDLPTGLIAERKLLRELAISIYWDNEEEASVWSPLGDFFGTAPGVNRYCSLMMGMSEEGFYSRWFMPFSDNALLQLSNDSKEEQSVRFIITHKPLYEKIEKFGRFHAKWHRDVLLIEAEDRWPDWPFLRTEGRGRFCGIHLHIWNPVWVEHWQGAKPGDYWWGEGDEKFFVDGEKFPSTFGTGTEDYFGYAWACPDHFDSAFHCQTLNENNSNGNISLLRLQVADNVPYQKSFEGVFEKYYPNEWEGNATKYAVTVYFYQAAAGNDPYQAVPVGERVGYFK
ncbi:DUF2961 domain-containing protein [Halocella sp. SP3-1]|nr:DUF2961 domain-containing protein [Halocella sp. SP3-1]